MSFIGSGQGVGNTSAEAFNSTGANLIVVFIVYDGPPTLTDTYGNTWAPLTERLAGTTRIRAWYCLNPTVGAGHVFTSSLSYSRVIALAFANVTAYESENWGSDGALTVNSIQSGSIDPAGDNRLLVAGCAWGNGQSAFAIDSSYTLAEAQTGVSGVSYGGGGAYQIQTTDTVRNPTWSWSGPASRAVAVHLAFATSGGGGGGGSNVPGEILVPRQGIFLARAHGRR